MATIRQQQLTFLQNTGEELCEFKVYTSDGNYRFTLNENILQTVPDNLQPIDQNLVTEYLRPLRFIDRKIDVDNRDIVNDNPTFRYDTYDWNMGTGDVVKVEKNQFIQNLFPLTPLPITDDYMVRSYTSQMPTLPNKGSAIITTSTRTFVNATSDYEFGFYYYFYKQCDNITYSCNENYTFHITIGLDNNGDGSPNYVYNFDDNKFEAGSTFSADHYRAITTTTNNQWVKYTTKLNSAPAAAGTSIRLLASIYPPARDSVDVYIGMNWYDNIYVANVGTSGNNLIEKTEIYESAGAKKSTGSYEKENMTFTNTLSNNDVLGKFSGVFKKRNDNETGNLDHFINQEMANDFRTFVKRYEGSYYKNDNSSAPIQMYNKIWTNFGTTVLQDPVSAIIDSMTYNVKQNTYELICHLPNQDDDVQILETINFEE